VIPQKKIVVEIDEEGNCSIDGKGFVGTECDKFMGEIEDALGATISTKDKPERRQRAANRSRNRERGR
jgi:hypothetical protein